MLKPSPQQVLPALFWPGLFTSLAFGLSAWCYPLFLAERLTGHWLREPAALKAVHSLALGQLGLLFLAVTVQALPVLFHLPHAWKALSAWGQSLWVFGVLLLISFFAGWRNPFALGGAVISLGLGWALLNTQARAMAGASHGRTFAWEGLGPALYYLGGMVLLGSLMAWGLLSPLLPQDPLETLRLHVHVGLWGFAGLAIFGFMPKLLRLFQASTGYPGWPLRACFKAVHLGLGLLFAHWLGWQQPWLLSVAGASLLGAALLFSLQLLFLLRAAKARRLDSSLGLQLTGTFFLLGAAGLDAWLLQAPGDWRQQAAAVALGLGGFVSLVMLGTLQRICAVLAWFQRFFDAAKTHAVPTAWDLVHPGLAWSLLPLQAGAAASLAWGLWHGSTLWIRLGGALGCAAQLGAIALGWIALRRGKATPFPNGINPFEEWAQEQAKTQPPRPAT